MANESVSKTITVAVTLCVVCAIVVSSAAVFLRSAQEKNKLLDLKANILASAGLLKTGIGNFLKTKSTIQCAGLRH